MERKKHRITLTVNGRVHELEVEPRERLIDVLRYKLGYTGVKEGCGTGCQRANIGLSQHRDLGSRSGEHMRSL